MNFKLSNFIQITYLQEKINPFWRPSRLLFKNWVITFGFFLNLLLVVFFSSIIPFLTFWRNIVLIVLILTSFTVGYLSCFNDIGDHAPAGILWANVTNFYFLSFLIIGKMIFSDFLFFSIIPSEFVDENSIIIVIIFSLVISPLFGVIGRFVHELSISIRVDRYREVEKIKLSFIIILFVHILLMTFNAFSFLVETLPNGLVSDVEGQIQILASGWIFMKTTLNLNILIYFLQIVILLAFFVFKIVSKRSELDSLFSITFIISIIISLISFFWIIVRLGQFDLVLQFDNWTSLTNNITINRDVFTTLNLVSATSIFSNIFFILLSLYELEQIDYKLYRRWT